MWHCGIVALLLSASLAAAAEFRPDKEGFIRDWLVAGPFPNELGEGGPAGLRVDFLASLGGEAQVLPCSGMGVKGVVFPADKGKLVAKVGATNCWGYIEDKRIDVTFKELHWKQDTPVVGLDDLHPDFKDCYAVYLATYVHSATEQRVHAWVGSDDDFRLWLNGAFVGEHYGSRPAIADSDVYIVTLKKGWNSVLLKIGDRTGGCGAVLRFLTLGKADPGLKVALELPQHQYMRQCRNIGRIDVMDGECFARIDLGEFPYLAGANRMKVLLGARKPVAARVLLEVWGSDGRRLWAQTHPAALAPETAAELSGAVTLAGGRYTLTVAVLDGQGRSLGILRKTFDVMSREALQSEHKTLIGEIGRGKRDILERSNRLEQVRKVLERKKQAIAEQYRQMEKQYAESRQKKVASYGSGAKSIDRPFVPAATGRASICINGDTWEIASAKSTGRSSVDESYIPTVGWEPVSVPTVGVELYFRSGLWPVKGGETLYWPAPKAIDQDRSCGFMPNPGREDNAMYLRTEITLPESWNGRRVLLCTELAHYKTRIWVNGQLAGEHVNWCNPLEMDITTYVKPGKNTLMAFVGREWLYKDAVSVGHIKDYWGLMGDVYLRSVPDVSVSDVWVITDWRQAKLITKTRLRNASDRVRTVTLRQGAILGGRTRLDVGERVVEVGPNAVVEVPMEKPWADPALWDVGSPVLYHLVSTVSEGGTPVDQHFQRFGFREIWRSRFDFWLNGKRLFIQGDVQENSWGHLSRPYYMIWYSLLRNTGNINTIRTHFDKQQSLVASLCDELGMLYIPQSYTHVAGLPAKATAKDVENYRQGPIFKASCAQQANWVRWLRNHPSIIIWDLDNEVFTQACAKPWDVPIRNDRCAALAEPYVKSLDPTRLVTRCGDQGTWGKMGAWRPDPPAEIANYHYPEFDSSNCVLNWQSQYERPVLYGETMYNAYGAWDNWCGATPARVATNANRLKHFLGLMKDLEIPGWVAMGLSHDGWIERRPGGDAFDAIPKPKTPAERMAWYKQGRAFPGMRMIWPAQSGPGYKTEFVNEGGGVYGYLSINWYIPGYPTHVSSAADRAYKEATRPMPAAPKMRTPEIIFTVTRGGTPQPGAMVVLTPRAGQGTEPIGVRADRAGKAWFWLREPGEYLLSVEGTDFRKNVTIRSLPNDDKAGLDYMPQVHVEIR